MENIEETDLDVQLNMGLVCNGKMRDLATLRETIRKTIGVNVIFHTFASEYLFIIKKSALSVEQQTKYNKKEQ
jgi:hypothetical protein